MGGWPHQEMLGSSQPKPVLKGQDGTEAKPLPLSVGGGRTEAPAQGANLNSQTSAQAHFKF